MKNYEEKKYDIFISYRHNNMTLVGELIHKLEPYYDVFWDQRLESGYWDKQLEKAMDNSKVVVINLNTNSLKKNSEGDDWFYKEIVYSMNTKNATEIIPICYDNYKIPDELNIEGITDEEKDKIKILREKQQAIVNTQILDDIVSRLVTYLDGLGIKTKIPYEPAKVEPEFLELDLISPTKAFKGREDELKKIDQLFRDNDTVFLSGIGGIGKTDLAKKYLEKKTGEYRCIFCKYDGNLENTLRKIKISGFDEDSFQKKEKILKKLLNENVLLVIDNFDFDNDECIDDYIEEFCKYSCKKLITTRNNFTDIEFDNKTSQLNIDTLKYEDLKSLFTEKYKNSISNEVFKQVLDLTGSLTLAVIIMASFCAKSGRSPEELCKMLSDGLNSLENKEKIKYYKDGNKQGTIPQIIRELFNLSDMDDEKKNTLRNLSLLNFMYVTRTIYREIAFFNSEGTFDTFDELKDTNWIKEIPGATEDTTYFELHPIINDLVREDLKPSPNNCPEVFLYIDNIIEKKSFLNLPPIEKKEFVVAFINNTSKENIPYFFEKYGDYVIHIKLLSDQLLLALKSYILNKKNFSSKEYRGLTQLSELLYFSVEEIEKIIILLMDSNENNRFERKLVIENIIDRQARFHSQDTQFGVVINRYGFKIKEETDFIFATLKTMHNRSFDVVQRNLKKINSIKRDILNSENDEKAFAEYIKGVQTISTKSDITYLSAILCEKCIQNKKNYEEIRDFEKFIYSNDSRYKRILLRQFLIYYKYFEIKGMSIEKCENLIEDVVCDRYTKKQLELMIYYVCKEKNDFDKKLKRYFELIAKNKSIDELITPIIKLQDVFNYELEEMPSDYLLSPLSQSIEFLECCFGENIAYNTLFELVYEWGEHIAEACDDRQLADVYSKKLRKIKKCAWDMN